MWSSYNVNEMRCRINSNNNRNKSYGNALASKKPKKRNIEEERLVSCVGVDAFKHIFDLIINNVLSEGVEDARLMGVNKNFFFKFDTELLTEHLKEENEAAKLCFNKGYEIRPYGLYSIHYEFNVEHNEVVLTFNVNSDFLHMKLLTAILNHMDGSSLFSEFTGISPTVGTLGQRLPGNVREFLELLGSAEKIYGIKFRACVKVLKLIGKDITDKSSLYYWDEVDFLMSVDKSELRTRMYDITLYHIF